MLILSFKQGETAYIGDDIKVVYLGREGGQIRLGFDAPKDIRIDRAVVRKRIEAEKQGDSLSEAEVSNANS